MYVYNIYVYIYIYIYIDLFIMISACCCRSDGRRQACSLWPTMGPTQTALARMPTGR